jgi:hypothetical protein
VQGNGTPPCALQLGSAIAWQVPARQQVPAAAQAFVGLQVVPIPW